MKDLVKQDSAIPNEPLMTIEIKEPEIGLEGWVCLHSLGKNGSSGGIRCAADVTKKEVEALAKAMTFKYSFFAISQGGAKAGLRVRVDEQPARKEELIRSAARHLMPLIKRSNIWSPWTDMNFYSEDLRIFYDEMGLGYTANKLFNSSHRTAIGAFWSLQACLKFYQLEPESTTLTLEGFGSVASYLSTFLKDAGIKMVATSNNRGTVSNHEGLDLDEVLNMYQKYGSAWIEQDGNWEKGEREDIFDIEADVMIPCARVHSIGVDKAKRINSKLLLPIANVPCTEEALEVLDSRNISFMPDFVVNGGGVSGHIKGIDDSFGLLFKAMFERMLKNADKNSWPVRKVAEQAAHMNYSKIIFDAYTADSFTLKIAKSLANRNMLPKNIFKRLQKENLNRIYSNIEELFSR